MHRGVHKEMPLPVILVVDGAAQFLAETGVGFGVVKVKFMKAMELELVEGETQFPRDVCPPDRKGIVMCWGEGHGVMVK